ncbi:NAD-dependent epimerase/dehydratase family protein [Paeniglutamicibacter cryotolerans]|uniref:NAD-dependent epimerase/dehydratase domain-containing protein n=1 Tax=Paeniglutamicibacter cryotolerans TaxID=670079 RepID=A0A839QIH2_9MICC|nr:NAD-dependent epimerase/dehydratase family protein [Paeniglutamicibacter cryotolerans]MBB2994544.1 hypothetical protein [Paeniglutamicibacter cryotolerans]
MLWNRTQSHFFALEPHQLWDVLKDPSTLPRWNRAVAALVPRGEETGPGTELDQVPNPPLFGAIHSRTAPPATITRYEEGRALAWRQPQPGGGLIVSWEIDSEAGGTRLTQIVCVAGPGSPVFVKAAARPLASRFAENCARLYTLAGGVPSTGHKVVIAGGNGCLGRALAADLLCRGHEIAILTRNPLPDSPFRQVAWDGSSTGSWAAELESGGGPISLVNLAGKLVDCRPTADNIEALRDSRVSPTRLLVRASRELSTPLTHWVQASTTAIYGDAHDAQLSEDSPLPLGADALEQMTGVALPWEQAAQGANSGSLHLLRTSIVLAQESPAFDRLALLARAGLGGKVGNGKQWVSWIHLADWLRVVRACLGLEPGLDVPDGPVVASAPHPVTNQELMHELRTRLAPGPLKKHSLATPTPLVRIGAAALRTDPALGLTGRHVTSHVLAEIGFEFAQPALSPALDELLG